MWEVYKKGYKAWLQLEKSLSENSVQAYLHDVKHLTDFLALKNSQQKITEIDLKDLEKFTKYVNELGMQHASQARIISGIKSFFKYCLIEEIVSIDPATLLEAPKNIRKLPDTLAFEEIEKIITAIDLSKP